MQVIFKKLNPSHHEMRIMRIDASQAAVELHTETYFLHDIVHYYVEQTLGATEGFWGMLAQGYEPQQLAGKANPLTAELRRIECIVGATQSVYSGYMQPAGFRNYLQSQGIALPDENFLTPMIAAITETMQRWKYLPVGDTLQLVFE